MIPFDFDYYRPDTLEEAALLYKELEAAGKAPVWYGGGSELISMARVGNVLFGAVIDIKSIPECRACGTDRGEVAFGAALTLSEIIASDRFPLLSRTAGRIADHTMQNRITLGGNLRASIIYRETALPLLLADATVTAAGIGGRKQYPIRSVFEQRLSLPNGEFLVGVSVTEQAALAPYFHQKKTKNEKIDYPLLTTAAMIMDGRLRIAFSGLASYPFRDMGAEDILNDGSLSVEDRAESLAEALSGVIQSDTCGSAEYRRFVLKDTAAGILRAVKDERLPCLC